MKSEKFATALRSFCKKIPKKFGDIKEIAYLCTVKTFKGHEAAAPKKAAYFVQYGQRNNQSGTAWGIGQRPQRYIP